MKSLSIIRICHFAEQLKVEMNIIKIYNIKVSRFSVFCVDHKGISGKNELISSCLQNIIEPANQLF